MIEAIVYTTNSGFTKAYAELLGSKTGLPAYNLANSIPPAAKGKPVIFLGWLMAGGLKGYKKAKAMFDVKAVCAVGMAPKEMDQTAKLKEQCGAAVPLFYLQGGFDMKRLKGIYKLMMQAMGRRTLKTIPPEGEATPEQQAMRKMFTEGLNCVSVENLQEVLDWYETAK